MIFNSIRNKKLGFYQWHESHSCKSVSRSHRDHTSHVKSRWRENHVHWTTDQQGRRFSKNIIPTLNHTAGEWKQISFSIDRRVFSRYRPRVIRTTEMRCNRDRCFTRLGWNTPVPTSTDVATRFDKSDTRRRANTRDRSRTDGPTDGNEAHTNANQRERTSERTYEQARAWLPRSVNSPRPPRCLSREWPVYMLTLCLRVLYPPSVPATT